MLNIFIFLILASNSLSGSKSAIVNPSMPVVFSSLISSCEKIKEFGKASFVIVSLNIFRDRTKLSLNPIIL